ncbi:MFS transporter [Clostridium botulinum]|uniref:MFS transporter n=1 Tax=Clostridium botulinum TaxID=1491 RepID=UPI000174E8FA|nr:MFS transporter [Clostridium botulinum]ACD53256.1 transport protein [Clostridium botulinum E3 str. Alaska E43]MBY6789308.1 MFS transporter [Clostridium botulinum]MBY6946657.1 MFS transporter [Clostridium botulinum]MBY7020286.1 MFS transporter [Clostridium botulinum]MCR1159154.1 MFS transporter [Clostridium botulinum]
MISILTNKNFRNFFVSDIISGFGVGLIMIAENWYVFTQTNSTKYVGFLLAFTVIASFIVSPIAGICADIFNRKNVISITYVVRISFLLVIALVFLMHGFDIRLMYLLSIINGIGWTFYMSTSRSFIQELLPKNLLIKGNSLLEICLQSGMLFSGAIFGIFFEYFGFVNILFINIIVFLISNFIVSRIQYNSIISTIDNEKFFKSFIAGLSYLRKRKVIFVFGIITIIPLAVTMIYNVVLPAYVNEISKNSSIVFGISDMFYGIGGLVSGFGVALIIKKMRNNQIIFLFFIIAISDLLSLYLNTNVFVLYFCSLLLGVSNSTLKIVMNTVLMENVDKQFMGRATAVWTAISLLIQAVGTSTMGIIIDNFGAKYGFLCMALLMFIGVISFVFIYSMINLIKKENSNVK